MNVFLPHSIRLPFGYTVTIKVVAARTLRRVAEAEVHGCWDVDTRTIYIDRNLGEREQKYVLTHEMMHAFADWQHHALDGGREAE